MAKSYKPAPKAARSRSRIADADFKANANRMSKKQAMAEARNLFPNAPKASRRAR